MSVFADSSALVKLYVDEDGCEAVRALTGVVVSQLARVEVPAALWGKHRVGGADPDDVRVLVEEFVADWAGDSSENARFAVVALTPDLLEDAAGLSATRSLRAYDAVQLAAARATAAADGECRAVAAFDRALRVAAAAEGFALVP